MSTEKKYDRLQVFTLRGKLYRYYRKGSRRVRLLSEPGTPEFDLEYEVAKQGYRPKLRRKHDADEGYFVYFARAETMGLIKIGHSMRPIARLYDIQLASPDRIIPIGMMPDDANRTVEAGVKGRFRSLCVRGEWYTSSPELELFMSQFATIPLTIPEEGAATLRNRKYVKK